MSDQEETHFDIKRTRRGNTQLELPESHGDMWADLEPPLTLYGYLQVKFDGSEFTPDMLRIKLLDDEPLLNSYEGSATDNGHSGYLVSIADTDKFLPAEPVEEISVIGMNYEWIFDVDFFADQQREKGVSGAQRVGVSPSKPPRNDLSNRKNSVGNSVGRSKRERPNFEWARFVCDPIIEKREREKDVDE